MISSLVLLTLRERFVVLATHWQYSDLLHVCFLISVGDQAYNRRVVSKLYDRVEDMRGHIVLDKQSTGGG
jgi:hypothetical protein